MNNRPIKRREFLKFAGIVISGLSLSGCHQSSEMSSRKPNIIFILADDLGYGDLGCYGQKQIQTPHLDRMAAEGIRFTQHYAGSTICAPSRCCLMTGLDTGHGRIKGNFGNLHKEDTTVLELLKSAGYRTAVIGKWGLGDAGTQGHPLKQGADRFFGYLDQVHAHNYYPEWLWDNDRKVFLGNQVKDANTINPQARGGMAFKKEQYAHDLMTNNAIEFIKNSANTPFFLYLAYTIPHANSESIIFNQHGMEVPDYGPYETKDWPPAQKGLAAMISRMDHDIGELMSLLKDMGIDENTIVLFSSDNGPHEAGFNDPYFFDSNGPLRGIKRDLYEGGIRVPLIVRWPGKIYPERQTDHISAFWDFLPTVCEIAGIKVPEGIDGISYLPVLLGRKQPVHRYLYWEFHERGPTKAVRKGPWKFIQFEDGQCELYNSDVDIGETVDLVSAHPQIVEEMKAYLQNRGSKGRHS